MKFLDLSLAALAENLALDEALLLDAEQGGPEVLRVWAWRKDAVVLGAGGCLAEDVEEEACSRDSVSILRRASGGGTVLLGPGCLIFSLVLAYQRDPALTQIQSSYCWILKRLAQSLHGLGRVECAGLSDLALEGRKISGNSQQRKRSHLLHHGTFLHHFDREKVRRYLRLPRRQPEYRRNREHADFLTNLPVDEPELKARLRETWNANEDLVSWPRESVEQLVREKYTREEWIRRR